jgi:holliday junction DNA helicase RuvA
MYEYIEGVLRQISEDSVVIDNNGIGYRIIVSKTCSQSLPEPGAKINLFLNLVIREDSHTLYGFLTHQEREFFCLLQQVTGIGPKVALNILGKANLEELSDAIFRKDVQLLTSIPGVGRKLAERISVELQERVSELQVKGTMPCSPKAAISKDSIRALQTLGFSAKEARDAIITVTKEAPHLKTVEELIQHALATKK